MRSYELATWRSRTDKGWMVTLYTQPWYHYAWAKIYHWYDMHTYKIPGALRLERLVDLIKYTIRRIPHEERIPWFANQDLRCFYLHHRGRKELATFELTEEQYHELGGNKAYVEWRKTP